MSEYPYNAPRAEFRSSTASQTTYAQQIVRGGLLALAVAVAWWLAKILVRREIESTADEIDDFLDKVIP